MATAIPLEYKSYFWDTDFTKIDPVLNKFYIIKRFLDRGDTNAIKWLLKNYDEEDLKEVVIKSRDISRATATFWGNVLKIDQNKIKCLQTPYSPIPFGLSS